MTTQIDSELGPTGRGSATLEQRFRVDPNLLGSLGEGEAFVVSQRRAQLVRVARTGASENAIQVANQLLSRPPARTVVRVTGKSMARDISVVPGREDGQRQAIDF